MNKYQEALDFIKNNNCRGNEKCGNLLGKEEYDLVMKSFATLQELIDNYSKIQQFDRAIYFNADGVVVNGISYEQLEKALDKACELLQDIEKDSCYYCPIGIKNCVDKDECGNGYCKKEKWKDYLLSEVSK